MGRLRLLIGAAILSGVFAAVCTGSEFDVSAARRLVGIKQKSLRIPGVAVAVTNGNSVVLAEGFGGVSAKTRLPIASLSKSFTSLAVMQLVEAGKISLDAPVRTYLPQFELADARGETITVRQLLNHTSGLSDTAFREKSVIPPEATLESAVGRLREATLVAAPGARRNYHNPNYWVLALIVEKVSGSDFRDYLRDRVLAPLGMGDTITVNSLHRVGALADGNIRVFGRNTSLPEPDWFLGGCCGVITTAEDLAKWLQFQSHGNSALLSDSGRRAMHEQGLGWVSGRTEAGKRSFSHNGFLFTFSSNQILLPDEGDGIGIAVVTDTGMGLTGSDADEIAAGLVEIVNGVSPEAVKAGGIAAWHVDLGISVLGLLVLAWAASAWRTAGDYRMRFHIALLHALPLLLFIAYPWLLRTLSRRDLNWTQSFYLAPALVIVLGLSALLTAVVGLRRSGGNASVR